VAELEKMAPESRKSLLGGGDLQLVTASPLSEDERNAASLELAPFGISSIAFTVDPSLIAGLDLRSATGVVHNSLAHDLHQISEALNNGDGSRT